MKTYKVPRPRKSAHVSATDAAKTFGRLIDRVRESRVTYTVERSGRPVVRIVPVEGASFTMGDFKALARALPRVDDEYLSAVDAAVARHNKPRTRRNPWAR